jgi:AraC-like DNA-binding protein
MPYCHHEQQHIAELIYRRDGLKLERIQHFDQAAHQLQAGCWRTWSFHITLSGTRYVSYSDRTYTLAPNTLFWHSSLKTAVRMRYLTGIGSEIVALSCSARRWRRFIEQHPAFHERNAMLLDGWPARPVLALQLAPPQLLCALRQLIVLGEEPNASEVALEAYCTLLLRLISDLRFDIEVSQENERRRRVELAQARIVARLGQPLGLEQIAADLNVSSRQLQRDFVAVTGLTPIRYLNAVRLSEANSLLAETVIPIAEVAALLGYVSLAHFSAAFRQAYGCSPRQVRESHLPVTR